MSIPPCYFLFANVVYLPLTPPQDQTCGAGKSEVLSQAVRRGRIGGRGSGVGVGSRRGKVRAKRSQGRRIISAPLILLILPLFSAVPLSTSTTSEPSVAQGICT